MQKKLGKQIVIYGEKEDVNKAIQVLKNVQFTIPEENLLLIQTLIDRYRLKAKILYDGYSVFSKNRISKEFKELSKLDSLSSMSDYFFNFLCLNFGINDTKIIWIRDNDIDDLKDCINKSQSILRQDAKNILNTIIYLSNNYKKPVNQISFFK